MYHTLWENKRDIFRTWQVWEWPHEANICRGMDVYRGSIKDNKGTA